MGAIGLFGRYLKFQDPEQWVALHREWGFRAALSSLVHRRYRTVRAVDHIDFTIEQGEVTAVEDPETNVTTLKSESSVEFTPEVFNELKSKVIEIRSSYIS